MPEDVASYVTSLVSRNRPQWDGDFWSCRGRPATAAASAAGALDADGLPALPRWLADDNAVLMPYYDSLGPLAIRFVAVTFPDAPDGRDPLLDDVYAAAPHADAKYAHLRWLSSSWWCASEFVAGVYLSAKRHPRQQCWLSTVGLRT